MKYTFKPSPNYRNSLSTVEIMRELTVCLIAVLVFAVSWYWVNYGTAYALRVIMMTVVAVGSALATEAIYFKLCKKKDILTELKHSFGWVTALILVLITKINVSYYAIAIATIVAIVFGKLVFGGFGQNIFNPAAFGEAIIMNAFGGSTSADFVTSATPVTTIKSYGWMMDKSVFSEFLEQFHGWTGILLGNYAGTIGSTCALLIFLCGTYLMVRRIIDWRVTISYVASVFVITLCVAMMKGMGLWYPFFHLASGGLLFGAVFMATDPVTNPITIPGRIIFGVGCGALTCILRFKSNLPDGVLFSILLMNMLSPAIDRLVDGNQIKDAKRIRNSVIAACLVTMLVAVAVGTQLEAKTPASTSTDGSGAAVVSFDNDFSANNVVCSEVSNDGSVAVYECEAKGLEGINKATVTVDVKKLTVKSVEVTEFNDTPGIGDMATTDEALAAYKGLGLKDGADVTTGATVTTTSIAAMVSAALNAAAGN